MTALDTPLHGLTLLPPDPQRDAPFALQWFEAPYGKDTLLMMGNAEHEIKSPTLEDEFETLQDFIELERQSKQLTWMLRYDEKTIGAIWLDLEAKETVEAPGIHIMIGNKDYRGRGIGTAAMQAVIQYAREVLHAKYVYSRNLATNSAITLTNQNIGLQNDGDTYTDKNGLVWQNTKLEL